jgi:hypothetical protein
VSGAVEESKGYKLENNERKEMDIASPQGFNQTSIVRHSP